MVRRSAAVGLVTLTGAAPALIGPALGPFPPSAVAVAVYLAVAFLIGFLIATLTQLLIQEASR